MSRIFTLAFAIRDRITAEVPALADCAVVDRQSDLGAIMAKTLAKANALCAIIAPGVARNPQPDKRTARFVPTFTVTLFAPAILQAADATAADDIIEAVAVALHGYWPAGMPQAGRNAHLQVSEMRPAPAENFAAWQLSIQTATLTPNPA